MTTYILRQRGPPGEALAEALDVAAVPAPDRLREEIVGDVLGDGGLSNAQGRAGLHTSRERMCEAEHESVDQRSGTTVLPRPV
jgi:hypothetical protein